MENKEILSQMTEPIRRIRSYCRDISMERSALTKQPPQGGFYFFSLIFH